MSDPVADDFEFIRKRMQEIETDDDPTLDPEEDDCPGCGGSGWNYDDDGMGHMYHHECPVCGNPHGFECP